jgi:hypothetical protein
VGGQRLELVRGGDEGETGDLLDVLGEQLGEARLGVEAGADGGTALGKLKQARQRRLDALDAVGDLGDVAGELLTDGQRRRILKMGAADLDDVGEFLGLGVQSGMQVLQRRDQFMVDLLDRRDVHSGREAVV